jgi:hypothetical protein
MNRLTEGMREGDLEDMVLPMISVDEYESKVDDNAVVFGFYVADQDAAMDLNRFIQKSPVTLLDTEVSPAPDQHGYYLVFFEILKNDQLVENVGLLLDEVTPLVKIESWQLRIRGVERLVPFSQPALRSHLEKSETTDPKGGKKEGAASLEEQVLEYLQPSGLTSTWARRGKLVLEGMGQRFEFDIIAFGPLDKIIAEQELGAQDISLLDAAKEMRVNRALGEGWCVSRISGLSLLSRDDQEIALILRDR